MARYGLAALVDQGTASSMVLRTFIIAKRVEMAETENEKTA